MNGFNAYVRVEEVTNTSTVVRRDGQTAPLVEGLVGDETGVISFRVIGEYAHLLVKGKVVAWRNGISEVFDEHQRLSLDKFGRLTVEDVYFLTI